MQIYSDKLFENPIEIIEIFEPKDVQSGLDKIEELKNKGLYLIGYMRYNLFSVSEYPIIYFEAYKDYKKFTPQKPDYKIGTVIKPLITKEEYINKIEYIKEKIKSGITYEVNYTYPSILKTNASDFDLYNFLLESQTTPYNSFIKNKYETILSFSPELFFKLQGHHILTKPMKGTIHRGKGVEEDKKLKEFLYNDEKNRAENIMIVDLLRNDLGKIAKSGQVNVDKLFDIEEHKTLFQMTSEISANLKEGVTLYDIINAIYPCGSITGAPKISTMRVISETEKFSREVYCGAIGYLDKDEAIFSVPIRILQKKKCDIDYKYYAGGAIVWDSVPEEEWVETLTKTKFLDAEFSLIETGINNFEQHIKRLKTSASELGFRWNNEIEKLKYKGDVVDRIELFKDGKYIHNTRTIADIPESPKIKIRGNVNTSNPFLYHKTNIRREIPKDVFDEIATNERGEITEGTFTNIAIKIGDRFFTPPISSGLLNGILRQQLIDCGKLEEKIIYPEDLYTAEAIYCLNSVRGMVEVEIC